MRLKSLFPRASYGKINPSEGMQHFTGVPENQAAWYGKNVHSCSSHPQGLFRLVLFMYLISILNEQRAEMAVQEQNLPPRELKTTAHFCRNHFSHFWALKCNVGRILVLGEEEGRDENEFHPDRMGLLFITWSHFRHCSCPSSTPEKCLQQSFPDEKCLKIIKVKLF